MIDKTIGPYRVLDKLGEGGMGEVYRARDAKLNRDVALKILPDAFAHDPERLARFRREAQVLASLNHPGIAHIYGLEEANGQTALVMELVPGPTLADRIARGALPLDEALPIGRQIADALEAAHELGIVHRDIKPANIKVRGDGTVKVLDFGLAKALDPAQGSGLLSSAHGSGPTAHADLTNSPTLTSPMTMQGVILGTAAYMSPEQARGKSVDKRTDIWAFGCVLYEMLTGRRAFEPATPRQAQGRRSASSRASKDDGGTIADVIAAVMTRDPDWPALPAETPSSIRRLLRRTLAKDPRDRLHDVADARIEIAEALEPSAVRTDAASLLRGPKTRWQSRLPWAIAAVSLLVGTAAWFWPATSEPLATPVARVQIPLPSGVHLAVDTDHPVLALSPDGSRLVFVGEQGGTRRLYLRHLADGTARVIQGTEGGASPFFSPDGSAIAYVDRGRLERVSLDGGVPVAVHAVTDVAVNHGMTWVSADAAIVAASPNSGLQRGLISGPTERALTEWSRVTPASAMHVWPSVLPGGRHVVFATSTSTAPQDARIESVSLDSGRIEPLINGGTSPRYSAGHLVYARRSDLYVVPFDEERAAVTGPERLLTEGVMTHANGAAQFAVSTNGVLAFVAGGSAAAEYSLVWVSRDGTSIVSIRENEGRQYMDPRLSPDDRQLAFTSAIGSSLDVLLHIFSNGSLQQLTTHPGEDFDPVWSPDGKHLAIASEVAEDAQNQGPGIAALPIEANRPPDPITRTPGYGHWEMPSSWSPSGWLAFSRNQGRSARDVWVRRMGDAEAEEQEIIGGPADEAGAVFSPDGEWIAYSSDELSGRPDIYVRPFKRAGRTHPISSDGGVEPLWSRDGRELFYRSGDRLMAVNVGLGPELQPAPPRTLFAGRFEMKGFGSGSANYDVARGGRFVMVQRKNLVRPTVIEVVLNWPALQPAVSK